MDSLVEYGNAHLSAWAPDEASEAWEILAALETCDLDSAAFSKWMENGTIYALRGSGLANAYAADYGRLELTITNIRRGTQTVPIIVAASYVPFSNEAAGCFLVFSGYTISGNSLSDEDMKSLEEADREAAAAAVIDAIEEAVGHPAQATARLSDLGVDDIVWIQVSMALEERFRIGGLAEATLDSMQTVDGVIKRVRREIERALGPWNQNHGPDGAPERIIPNSRAFTVPDATGKRCLIEARVEEPGGPLTIAAQSPYVVMQSSVSQKERRFSASLTLARMIPRQLVGSGAVRPYVLTPCTAGGQVSWVRNPMVFKYTWDDALEEDGARGAGEVLPPRCIVYDVYDFVLDGEKLDVNSVVSNGVVFGFDVGGKRNVFIQAEE